MKTLLALVAVIALATYISGLLAAGIIIGVAFCLAANIYALLNSRTF